jgi:hypothetical protein
VRGAVPDVRRPVSGVPAQLHPELLRVAHRPLVADGVTGVTLVAGSAHTLPLATASVEVVSDAVDIRGGHRL